MKFALALLDLLICQVFEEIVDAVGCDPVPVEHAQHVSATASALRESSRSASAQVARHDTNPIATMITSGSATLGATSQRTAVNLGGNRLSPGKRLGTAPGSCLTSKDPHDAF